VLDLTVIVFSTFSRGRIYLCFFGMLLSSVCLLYFDMPLSVLVLMIAI
jgi:hypothetical protein